jgi:hypothetical protein
VGARYLLISNPPHGDVDALAAASQFGLTAAEVGMKANYALPEIWFADEDEAQLQHIAAALGAAGLETVLVAGSDLLEIPVQNPAESFDFTEWGLQLDLGDSEWMLAYDAPAIAVYGRPRVDTQEGKAPARSVASQVGSWGRARARRASGPDAGLVELGASPFLDLFAPSDAGLRRASIVQEITSFSELPGDSPHGLSAMQNLSAEFENRFENVYVDRRLVDMTLRGISRVVTGATPGEPTRTGFSYATEALAQLLASLSPDLKDIHQADLSSRLVYLTNRSRIS